MLSIIINFINITWKNDIFPIRFKTSFNICNIYCFQNWKINKCEVWNRICGTVKILLVKNSSDLIEMMENGKLEQKAEGERAVLIISNNNILVDVVPSLIIALSITQSPVAVFVWAWPIVLLLLLRLLTILSCWLSNILYKLRWWRVYINSWTKTETTWALDSWHWQYNM